MYNDEISKNVLVDETMKTSLVLQLPIQEIVDYDQLIEIEEALAKYLHGFAHVDGHDSGKGEMNIFIFTDKPDETFDKAKFVIKAAGKLGYLSAAYRSTTKDEYLRLWPIEATKPFTVT